MQKTCYYELLEVPFNASEDQIKKAYKKAAFKWHPDKNLGREEEARVAFQEVQTAYEILSDPQVRAWYDGHREQFLRGEDTSGPGEDASGQRIRIWSYFRKDCYKGFDPTDKKGFYSVYGELFRTIVEEEVLRGSSEEFSNAPAFGGPNDDEQAFYKFWMYFSTSKPFMHADKWQVAESSNRWEKRQMQAENTKARRAAMTEFNESVRSLVRTLQKRDPRVIERTVKKAAEARAKAEKEQEAKKQRRLEEIRDKKKHLEEEKARWEQLAADREAAKQKGQVFVDEEENNSAESDNALLYYCECCRKTFRSEQQLKTHERSKKHQKALVQYLKRLEEEEEEEEEGDGVLGEADGSPGSTDSGAGLGEVSGDPAAASSGAEQSIDDPAVRRDADLGKCQKGSDFKSGEAPEYLSGKKVDTGLLQEGQKMSDDEKESGNESTGSETEEEEMEDEDEGGGEGEEEEDGEGEGEKAYDKGKSDGDEDESEESENDADQVEGLLRTFSARMTRRHRRFLQDLKEDTVIESRATDVDPSSAKDGDGGKEAQRKGRRKAKKLRADAKGSSPCTKDIDADVLHNDTEESLVLSTEKGDASTKKKKSRRAATSSEKVFSCQVCHASFPTRNKMFQHINLSGHATFKPAFGHLNGKKKTRS